MTTAVCPTCHQPLLPLAEAIANGSVSEAEQAQLPIDTPPQPRQAGGLGCTTLALSFAIALAAAVIIGAISEFTIGTDFPAQGMRRGEAGVFSGIGTFIVVMISLFSVFVYRQARNDAVLKERLATWHQERATLRNDWYCTQCQKRVTSTEITSPKDPS